MSAQTVLVLGMHRSGTSLLTAGLEALGVSLGPDLMPPDHSDNPKGYFENPRIVALNDRLLALDGHHWASLGYGVDIDYSTPRYADLRKEAETAVGALAAAAAGPIALKDPRICLTLPFWLSVIEQVIGPDIFGLMILRHPVEVAMSLKARSARAEWRKVMAYTEGDETQSVLLWLSYIHHALHHMRGRPLRVITQDSLLEQPGQALESTAAFLSLTPNPEALDNYVSRFVDLSLSHHRAQSRKAADITASLTFVDELWSALELLDGRSLSESDQYGALGLFPPMEFAYTYSAQSASFIKAKSESLEMAESLEGIRLENTQLLAALDQERQNVLAWEQQSNALKEELRRNVLASEQQVNELQEELRASYARASELDALAQSNARDRFRAEAERDQAEQLRDLAEQQRDLAEQEMWRMRATLSWRLTQPLREASRRKALLKAALQQRFPRFEEPIAVLVPAEDPRPDAGSRELEFAVERILVAHGRVHGWGWLFLRHRAVAALEFGAENDEGGTRAMYGLDRPDVARAFPEVPAAQASGFLLNGLLPQDARYMFVRVFSTDRDQPVAVLRIDLRQFQTGDRSSARYLNRLRIATGYVRRRDLGGLVRRVRNQRAIAHVFQRKLTSRRIAELLGSGAVPAAVIIDHNLGGGANLYRDRLSAQWVADGTPVLLVYFNLSTLDYVIELRKQDGGIAGRVESLEFLNDAVESGRVSRIFYNNAVSFPDPVSLVDQLTTIAESGRAPVHIAVHDYFPVCPSWTLLDYRGRYCGVPDTSTCVQCLAMHEGDAFTLVPKVPVAVWREVWGRLLLVAGKILFYSNASKTIVQRAFPALGEARMETVPHRVDYLGSIPRRERVSPSLHVGVVGAINMQKGALVIEELSRLLVEKDPDARLTVFGTLEGVAPGKNVSITGEYDPRELPEMIDESGVSVFLFPSIWPETFSYVTGELMAMRLPVVAFALGAPAERLERYDNALLVEEVTASALLPALYQLHGEQQHQWPTRNRSS